MVDLAAELVIQGELVFFVLADPEVELVIGQVLGSAQSNLPMLVSGSAQSHLNRAPSPRPKSHGFGSKTLASVGLGEESRAMALLNPPPSSHELVSNGSIIGNGGLAREKRALAMLPTTSSSSNSIGGGLASGGSLASAGKNSSMGVASAREKKASVVLAHAPPLPILVEGGLVGSEALSLARRSFSMGAASFAFAIEGWLAMRPDPAKGFRSSCKEGLAWSFLYEGGQDVGLAVGSFVSALIARDIGGQVIGMVALRLLSRYGELR